MVPEWSTTFKDAPAVKTGGEEGARSEHTLSEDSFSTAVKT